MRRRKWLFRFAAMIFGLTAAFILSEIALRVAGIGFPSFYAPDEYCGSRLRHSTSGVWITEGHGYVSINSHGFRGPQFSLAKPSDVVRIAVLGDSMIEAMQVDHQHTFTAQLQQRLQKAISSESRVEVINCGVAGYGTAQELLMLRHYVISLQPDLILLSFFPHNDIRNNSFKLAQEPPVPYFNLNDSGELELDESFRQSAAWLAASTAYEQFKASLTNRCRILQVLKQAKLITSSRGNHMLVRSVDDQLQAMVDEAPYAYQPTSDEDQLAAIDITGRLLREFAKECRTHGIPCVIFSSSSPVQVFPDPDKHHALARRNQIDDWLYSEKLAVQLCGEYASCFFPLTTRMQQELKNSRTYFHGFANVGLGVGHWNENGHATAARLVADHLMEQRLLSPLRELQ